MTSPVLCCSSAAAAVGEPLAGTAPVARAWVALEQPGPWGPKALVASHLDRDLGERLMELTAAIDTTVVLIRRPGRHADLHTPLRRTLLVAYAGPGEPWLEAAQLDDPREVLELDFAAVADGKQPGIGELRTDPVALVCTNGKRDLCCAALGRPLAHELADRLLSSQIWESSHIGGHRFAPTCLLLPWGFVLGRATGSDVVYAVHGRLPLDRLRGRSVWPRDAQAAEIAVRQLIGETRPLSLDIEPGDPSTHVVRHPDGRAWTVTVTSSPLPPRPESCSKEPEPGVAFHAEITSSVAA